MPSAPEVEITPAPNLLGKPALTMAGRRIEPMATTVAGLNPTPRQRARRPTPARPRPPYQWPTMLVAKLIIRVATPPWVRKLPARMKNGMAMISNFSMPVKSLAPPIQGYLGHREQEGQDGEAEGNRDRHAGEHEDGQQAENHEGVH